MAGFGLSGQCSRLLRLVGHLPAMKPVEVVERAVRNSSKTRDLVLDPFGGSGSTLIACEKAGDGRGSSSSIPSMSM